LQSLVSLLAPLPALMFAPLLTLQLPPAAELEPAP
jgi:hypothetical protein